MLIDTKRSATSLGRLLGIEVAVAVLVATLPMIISFLIGGTNALNTIVSSLIPVTELWRWSAGLTAVAIVIVIGNGGLQKNSDFSTTIWRGLSVIADEVVSSLQSILRIAAGVMVPFVLLWRITDPQTFEWGTARYLLAFGAAAMFEAFLIRLVLDRIDVKYALKARSAIKPPF